MKNMGDNRFDLIVKLYESKKEVLIKAVKEDPNDPLLRGKFNERIYSVTEAMIYSLDKFNIKDYSVKDYEDFIVITMIF